MTLKRIALVFCVLCSAIVCSCKLTIEDVWLTYTFDNKSSFAVQVTLSKPYKIDITVETQIVTETDGVTQIQIETKTERSESTFTTPFLVSGSELKCVYIRSDGNVDFQWTANSAEDNPKIHCVTKGPKATFNNR